MTTHKKIGVWMDHASARLMEYSTGRMGTEVINSSFTHDNKISTLNRSEHIMHNKEQHEQAGFYDSIGKVLLKYDEVLLFGPTTAKQELYNTLKENHLYAKIRFDVKEADKLTEYQQYTLVRTHFDPVLK